MLELDLERFKRGVKIGNFAEIKKSTLEKI